MTELLEEYERSAAALEERIRALKAAMGAHQWQIAAARARVALLEQELLDLRAAIRQMRRYLEERSL